MSIKNTPTQEPQIVIKLRKVYEQMPPKDYLTI